MLKNYFKIAWRNLLKSKVYSLINIVGLATGMAVALLIGLWIWDEVSFNSYHTNHGRLAQVMNTIHNAGQESFTGSAVSLPQGPELRNKYGDNFKYLSLASWNTDHILAVGEKKLSVQGMSVQPQFPVMITLNMLKGRQTALEDPSSIMLSASVAKALFGDADPFGKIIKVDNKLNLKVGGVYEDLPYNTTFRDTKILMAWDKYLVSENWLRNAETNWDAHSSQMFVQLSDHADLNKTNIKIRDIINPHLPKGQGKEYVFLHPMDKWHLYSDFRNGKLAGGRIQFVWLFGIIGVFVLLLACINFMNLSTARSEKRAREVGIRKAIGSLRGQLIGQFLSESVLVAFLSFLLSIILIQVSLPFFNSIADKQMSIPWGNPVFWILILGFTLFTGLVSGSYPAFYLSAFNPIKVLKGTFRVGRFASIPRKVLVVIQFTVSVSLIIGTIIVFRQIQFAKNRPVGYTREGLITVMMNTPDLYGHYGVLRDDLLKTGMVADMAQSSSPSTGVWSDQIGFDWEDKDPNTVPAFGTIAVTHDFGNTIGWQIREGRDFSRNFQTDSISMILNEAAVKQVGFKEPVGRIIKFNNKNYTIVGVVKDMVMESPYQPIKPTVFFLDYEWANVITVKIKPGAPLRDALSKIEKVFKKYNPGSPFTYQFTDEEYAKKFSDEERIGNLASIFAVLAIFISCLGLFGLASFVAEQRTKEIGVRKVLGASVFNLWKMLSKDFVALVVISCLIAIPLAWYFLNRWLQQYEYRTGVSWWIFIVAATGALAITLLTVSYQAVKAALMNPVKSLRTE
jgi:ABC-type antimicrobial peptide transport system permease subunit